VRQNCNTFCNTFFFLYSKDDPFKDLTQSEWERLDNAATEAYNTTLENEGIQQTGK
jgi:hypothetical protein